MRQTDTQQLRVLWDLASRVVDCHARWHRLRWTAVNAEELTEECKAHHREIRGLSKAIKAYPATTALEESVRMMLTVLPLLHDLHHPAMKRLHWSQIAKVDCSGEEVGVASIVFHFDHAVPLISPITPQPTRSRRATMLLR